MEGQRVTGRAYLTFRLCLLVIGLADELPIFHEIKFVAGVQLARAKGARETRQMVNQFLRPSYHLRRRQTLAAARAFRPETPATPTTYNIFTLHSHINDKTIRCRMHINCYRDSSDLLRRDAKERHGAYSDSGRHLPMTVSKNDNFLYDNK